MITLEKLRKFFLSLQSIYNDKKLYLSELDSAIGDGDHGVNMARGFDAVINDLNAKPPVDLEGVFKSVSMSLIKTVGGASGPLYGTFFRKMSLAAGKKNEIGLDEWIDGMSKGIEGIVQLGKAQKGDKTMLDALFPALEALKAQKDAGKDLADALSASAKAAQEGAISTIPLIAKKGRASYLGERSAGHQDPGATSSAMLLQAAADTLS
ncbi:MAG: dihydroxyacetone kinase subunit L [Elusimicrobiota bacterium]|jgi:dihydroxyacetone kinase-like protein|nr:dihydroxyacetone kinase subunit L [Elusimicrobiota bacterium]